MITLDEILGLDIAFFGEPSLFLASQSVVDSNTDYTFFGQPMFAPTAVPNGAVQQGEIKEISVDVSEAANLIADLSALKGLSSSVHISSGVEMKAIQLMRKAGFELSEISNVIALVGKHANVGTNVSSAASMITAFNRLREQGIDLHEEAKVSASAGVTRSVAFNPMTGTAMVMSLPRKRNHGSLAVLGEASVSEMFVARVRSSSYDIDVHCDTDANFSRAMSVIADIGSVVEVIDEINRERGAELSLEEKAMLDFNMIAVQLEFQKWAVIVYDKKVVVGRDGVYRVITTKTRHKL